MKKRFEIDLFTPHEGQKNILENKRRFNAIVCARRFGKTELISQVNRPLIAPAVFGNAIIGMFSPVMKDFERTWEAIKTTYEPLIRKIDNQKHIIWFLGGGELYIWSLANIKEQDNGRGWPFDVVIYEETQKIPDDVFRHNWTKAVRPALSDKMGIAYFIGTASGQNNYWHKICCRGAKNGNCTINSDGDSDLILDDDDDSGGDDWITFRMVSTVNPIMTQKEVDAARNDMDDNSWKQEFYSHFINFGQLLWVYVFNDKALKKKVMCQAPAVNWRDVIYISFDFNKVPMTALVMQKKMFTPNQMNQSRFKYAPQFKKAFKIGDTNESATIYDTCKAIRQWVFQLTGKKIGKWTYNENGVEKIERFICSFPIKITGDASGNVTSGMVKDPTTYYKIIKDELGLGERQIEIPSKNPFHADSHLQVNTILSRCPETIIDSIECAELIRDIERIKDDGSHGLAKGSGEAKQADLLDCMRYMFNTFCNDIWIGR